MDGEEVMLLEGWFHMSGTAALKALAPVAVAVLTCGTVRLLRSAERGDRPG